MTAETKTNGAARSVLMSTTVKELRRKLEELSLDVSGTKGELVDRLLDYRQNAILAGESDTESPPDAEDEQGEAPDEETAETASEAVSAKHPLEDSPVHGRTVNGLADHGILYAEDVLEYVGDAGVPVNKLKGLKGVGAKGAQDTWDWVCEVAGEDEDVRVETVRPPGYPQQPIGLQRIEDSEVTFFEGWKTGEGFSVKTKDGEEIGAVSSLREACDLVAGLDVVALDSCKDKEPDGDEESDGEKHEHWWPSDKVHAEELRASEDPLDVARGHYLDNPNGAAFIRALKELDEEQKAKFKDWRANYNNPNEEEPESSPEGRNVYKCTEFDQGTAPDAVAEIGTIHFVESIPDVGELKGPACGFNVGPEGAWPEDHYWTPNAGHVTCEECMEALNRIQKMADAVENASEKLPDACPHCDGEELVGRFCMSCRRDIMKSYDSPPELPETVEAPPFGEINPPTEEQAREIGKVVADAAEEQQKKRTALPTVREPISPDPSKNRKLPDQGMPPTVKRIFEQYESERDPSKMGESLSIGSIGLECERQIWYRWRWALQRNFGGRLLRIFERGDLEEDRFTKKLREIGVQVWVTRADVMGANYFVEQYGGAFHVRHPQTRESVEQYSHVAKARERAEKLSNKQIKLTALDGHLAGYRDGMGRGFEEAPVAPHVLEYKTANDKGFNRIKDLGVEAGKPTHYGQCTLYMYFSGVDRCYYLVTNKDTEEIYGERIKLDPEKAKALMEKAKRIIGSEAPPERISEDPTFWKCKFCDYSETCHSVVTPDVHCRTCVHSTPVLTHDGPGSVARWQCERGVDVPYRGMGHGFDIDRYRQHMGCRFHLYIPDLLGPFLEYVNASDAVEPVWVKYQDRDGRYIYNRIQFSGSDDRVGLTGIGDRTAFTSQELSENPIKIGEDYAELRRELDKVPF